MGKLFVVATPIGNLEDITLRALKILFLTSTIACEDTRRTGLLMKLLEERYAKSLNSQFSILKPKKYISVRDWNEQEQVIKIIEALQEGDVALVSDAGTPLISDPGYKLVNVVRAAGFEVVPIPGVSALTTALSVSGLPTDRVKFWGFWSEKFELDQTATNVFYENPTRLKNTLDFIKNKYDYCEIVIANEMTKIHEAFLKPDEIDNVKGEVTILVSFDRRK